MSDPSSPPGTVSIDLVQDHDLARADRRWRRAAVVVLSVFVAAGILNIWGPRQGRVEAVGEHHRITLSAPAVSRGGLATTWQLVVRRHDGEPIAGEVEVVVDESYLAIFDQNAIDPTPAASWSADRAVHWRFDLPDEIDTFTVTLDARIQPDARWRHRCSVEVHVGGETIAADTTTWLVP